MKIERAIEILNPEHREHYESIEPVNEACRMGMIALEKRMPKKVEIWNGQLSCPDCGALFGGKEMLNQYIPWDMPYCKCCGQRLDWSDTE